MTLEIPFTKVKSRKAEKSTEEEACKSSTWLTNYLDREVYAFLIVDQKMSFLLFSLV